MDTSPLCIFCGGDRDITDDTCPSCGRGWVDRLVTGAVTTHPHAVAESDAASDRDPADGSTLASAGLGPAADSDPGAGPAAGTDAEMVALPTPNEGSDPPTFEENLHPPIVAATGSTVPSAASAAPADEDPGPAPRNGRRVPPWLAIGLSVLAVVAAWFLVLAWIAGQDDDVPSVLPTTTTTVSTTLAPDEAAPSPTTGPTAAATTTTTAPTTTTVPPLEPEGDPIATADLALGAFALGPLDFGDADALPRLVASLGQPDTIADAGTDLGLCDGEGGFAAAWGPFTAIFDGSADESVLVGYRLGKDGGHPAAGLATLSGLEVGATVSELETVYDGFTVVYEDIDGVATYIVVRTSDEVTLLWGPLSAADETGTVEGIYSPLPCDGGPVPSV